MRRTSATHLVCPIDEPVVLDALRCSECGRGDVMGFGQRKSPNGMNEGAWCFACWAVWVAPNVAHERTRKGLH